LRHELGGYGSDHVDRPELVRLALERVAAAGHDVVADRVWVIGDTPRDHACAVANGVRSMLVATGSYAVDELTGLGADIVVDDLTDLATVVGAIGA
jgi:phosphoglycolate phosphatase-like HAD superfamily hydrolase